MQLLKIKRFFTKNKTNIFSMLIFILPFSILAYALLPKDELQRFYSVLLIVSSIFIVPRFVKIGIKVEDYINLKLATVTPSRLIRVLFHLPLTLLIYYFYNIYELNVTLYPSILLLVLASASLHAIAVTAAYHGFGDRVGNILFSFLLSSGMVSFVLAFSYGWSVVWLLVIILFIYMALGLFSDMRAFIYPKSGIGVYFGTFNPIHKTHLKIIQEAVEKRGLYKVYIHSTTVPKLHRTALDNNEIEIKMLDGMRVYSKTKLADSNKNYFPTGNKFYEYEVRKELIKAGIHDSKLTEFVEVLDLPEIYEREGFFGIIKYIKSLHPKDMPIHGIHGSDTGGMWVRNIFDGSGWIYPYPVKRKDNISATSIRDGAVGFTSPTIEAFLTATRAGKSYQFPSGYIVNHPPKNSEIG